MTTQEKSFIDNAESSREDRETGGIRCIRIASKSFTVEYGAHHADNAEKMLVCHDVRYDGESVILFDGTGQMISSHVALLYRGLPEIVNRANGNHVLRLNDSESLVVNPNVLSQLSLVSDYQWYVKNCLMKEINATMFVEWKPLFVPDVSRAERSLGGERDSKKSFVPDLPTKTCAEEYHIIPSIRSPIYTAKRNTVPLVPLLETLMHVNQAWSHMTLCQIACSITGSFRAEFNDMRRLMGFLFEHARPLFAELCRTENTPLHKLHQSDFNVTFEHNQSRPPNLGMIRAVKKMENVVMVPLSSIVDKKTYGDIPWLIANPHEKDIILRKAKFISKPFGFFENSAEYTELEGNILFQNVCVLPEMRIEETEINTESENQTITRIYPAGAILGIVVYDDGTKDTVLRGELFNDASTKEQIILTFLFNAYIEGQLNQTTNCSRILRMLPLYEEQLTVRKTFIDAIQNMLFSST